MKWTVIGPPPRDPKRSSAETKSVASPLSGGPCGGYRMGKCDGLDRRYAQMSKTITIDIDDIGVAEQAPDVKLRVSVRRATSPDQFNEVEISGTRSGLTFLAKHILRIAATAEESHTHLDRDCHDPIYESDDDWWLTIERDDNTWGRLERKTQQENAGD